MSERVTDGQRQRHATVVLVAVADDVGYVPVTDTDDNLAVADAVDDAIDSVAVSDGGSERLDNEQSDGYSVRFSNGWCFEYGEPCDNAVAVAVAV